MPSPASRIQAVIWSLVISSLISLLGAGIWTLLITRNLETTPSLPWAIPIMAVILWLIWQYLDGKGWPRTTAKERHAYLRAKAVSRPLWTWGLLASLLALIALAGLWIVLVELVGAGGNPTIPDYSRYPRLTVVLGLLMGSLVSPFTEEAGFRGYAQSRLERVFPAAAAIGIASLLFALWHGPTQGFVWPKLLFYFIVGVAFGTTACLTQSVLPALPAHILGDLTFFFLIWPYDSSRPLVWRDGAGPDFWASAALAVLFGGLAILSYRRLARITRETRTAGSDSEP